MFTSQPAQTFLRSLDNLPAHQTLYSEDNSVKKDGITPRYDSIVKINVQNFPSTEQTKKMMLALFADDDLFVKDDFQRSGETHLEGCQHN